MHCEYYTCIQCRTQFTFCKSFNSPELPSSSNSSSISSSSRVPSSSTLPWINISAVNSKSSSLSSKYRTWWITCEVFVKIQISELMITRSKYKGHWSCLNINAVWGWVCSCIIHMYQCNVYCVWPCVYSRDKLRLCSYHVKGFNP